jgi:urease accessory protein
MLVVPSGPGEIMQRSHGSGTLAVKSYGGRTRIDRLHQSGNAKIRIPKTHGDALEAVLINTAGGITGGDTLKWTLEAGSGTAAVVTTQACERIYRSTGDTGTQETRIDVAAGASLFWLPQETILFDGGRLHRKLDVSLAEDARFLGLETIVLGREAMGETVDKAFLHDRWRIRRGENLVHADDVRFDLHGGNDTANLSLLGQNRVFATLVSITPDDGETRNLALTRTRALLTGGASAASLIGGKIIVRLAASSSYEMRKLLLPVIALFMNEQAMPKVWRL